MNKEELKNKALQYSWEPMLERPLSVFTLSLFKGDTLKDYYARAGVSAHYRAVIYQNQSWYRSPDIFKEFQKKLSRYLQNGGSIRKISLSCTKLFRKSKPLIITLCKSDKHPLQKLKEYYALFSPTIVYIWITLGLEPLINSELEVSVAKHYKNKTQEIIPDLIKPVKKTAYERMEDDLRNNVSLEVVVERWGWIKDRDGFGDPFTVKELKILKSNILKISSSTSEVMKIPKNLQKIVSEGRELTFLRTHRTDNIHELLFFGRPIFKAVAEHCNISFPELRNYSAHDLMKNKLVKYPFDATRISYDGQMEFYQPSLIKTKSLKQKVIRGSIAFPGIVTGLAKIVKSPSELKKVREGDILVAQMTFPSFIIAMRQASAFITDEGGITCHAAIIAREMKKPCIIATKIATKVLKDGDMVEVDADKGVIRIIGL